MGCVGGGGNKVNEGVGEERKEGKERKGKEVK